MNGKYKNTEEDVIDLSIVFNALLKHWLVIAIITVLGAVAAFSVTKYFIPNRYEATATVIVNNKAGDTQYLNQSDILSSKGLAELYSIIIKSDTVVDQIVKDFDGKVTGNDLKRIVRVATVSETQVVEISVTSTDPEYAKKVVEKFVKYSKPVILEKVEAGSVKDLNVASLSNNGKPISPNKKKNTMLGAAAGFILAAGIIILKELFNTTLKTEADVTSVLNVPLLGVIPMVDRKEFRGK